MDGLTPLSAVYGERDMVHPPAGALMAAVHLDNDTVHSAVLRISDHEDLSGLRGWGVIREGVRDMVRDHLRMSWWAALNEQALSLLGEEIGAVWHEGAPLITKVTF